MASNHPTWQAASATHTQWGIDAGAGAPPTADGYTPSYVNEPPKSEPFQPQPFKYSDSAISPVCPPSPTYDDSSYSRRSSVDNDHSSGGILSKLFADPDGAIHTAMLDVSVTIVGGLFIVCAIAVSIELFKWIWTGPWGEPSGIVGHIGRVAISLTVVFYFLVAGLVCGHSSQEKDLVLALCILGSCIGPLFLGGCEWELGVAACWCLATFGPIVLSPISFIVTEISS